MRKQLHVRFASGSLEIDNSPASPDKVDNAHKQRLPMTRQISFDPDLNRFRFFVGSDRGFVQIQLNEIPGSGFNRFLVSLPIDLFAFLPDDPGSGKDFFQFLILYVAPMPSGQIPLL
jgi:hypothetical protein